MRHLPVHKVRIALRLVILGSINRSSGTSRPSKYGAAGDVPGGSLLGSVPWAEEIAFEKVFQLGPDLVRGGPGIVTTRFSSA